MDTMANADGAAAGARGLTTQIKADAMRFGDPDIQRYLLALAADVDHLLRAHAEEASYLRQDRDEVVRQRTQLAEEVAPLKTAEREISDAYLRVRKLLNAYDTKPGGTDRFEVTERCIETLKADLAAAEHAVAEYVSAPAVPDAPVFCAHCETKIARCPNCGKAEWRIEGLKSEIALRAEVERLTQRLRAAEADRDRWKAAYNHEARLRREDAFAHINQALADRGASLAALAQDTRWHLLDAPCLWCGYNGAGYFQTGTHSENCPWHNVGGAMERGDKLPYVRYPDRLASSSLAGPGTADPLITKLEALERWLKNPPHVGEANHYLPAVREAIAALRAAAFPAAPSTNG